MAKFTRRGLLGSSAAVFGAGLAACNGGGNGQAEGSASRNSVGADTRAPYRGEVAFQHGVASGDPLQNWVILWTRVTPLSGEGSIPVAYGVFEDEALERPVAFGLTEARAASDYTVKVDVDGLSPGRTYFYRFEARTEAGQVLSPLGRTRTLPDDASTAPIRFAFVSCSNYPFGYFNVYRELSKQDDLDAIIHLGDYLYEYGIDAYGGEVGAELGRNHDPILEIVTLEDYRQRHAQYKSDPDLQAAHARAPWLCTWDDHESTNNSYRTGAQNHNPEDNEGDWTDRKQVAVQAYLEWMPVRDPEAGRAMESIYRKFDYGKIATVFCLESRLTGRSDEISWFTELAGKEAAEVPMAAAMTMQKVNDPARTMLGQAQEDWLAKGLAASTGDAKAWQVLANQTIMAKVRPPNFTQTLTPEQIAAQTGYVAQLVPFSQLGLPWNLDAWDGFPAARERLYTAAKNADARLVTLTGDTHTAWANALHDGDGERRGVEFGCTSVTSPGFGTYFEGDADLGGMFADANRDVNWYDPYGHGFTLLTLTRDAVEAEFVKVSDVLSQDYTVETTATFRAEREDERVSALTRI